MKKIIYITTCFVALSALISSCSEDKLKDESIIKTTQTNKNNFDKWLDATYVSKYNIRFKYRYEDNESDMSYFTVPATYEDAIKMAHLIKYLCIEAYDEVGGETFTKQYFPKLIYCIGEFEYKNNGTYILGTAESGKKILMAGTNNVSLWENDVTRLNYYYFKTIHHEFTHILNQTADYSEGFKLVTPNYVADLWNTQPYNGSGTGNEDYFLKHGFISSYSQHSDTEDFAEMLSIYVVSSADEWEALMVRAGSDGRRLIETKMTIVKNYMRKSFGVDLDLLRTSVQKRQKEVADGHVNITDLTIPVGS